MRTLSENTKSAWHTLKKENNYELYHLSYPF